MWIACQASADTAKAWDKIETLNSMSSLRGYCHRMKTYWFAKFRLIIEMLCKWPTYVAFQPRVQVSWSYLHSQLCRFAKSAGHHCGNTYGCWGLSIGYFCCWASVFLYFRELRKKCCHCQPVEKRRGYTKATITAQAPGQHKWASPPDCLWSKTVMVEYGCLSHLKLCQRSQTLRRKIVETAAI